MYQKTISILLLALICAFTQVKASNYISCDLAHGQTAGKYWSKSTRDFQHPIVTCADRLSDTNGAERNHRYQIFEERPAPGKAAILCPSPYTYLNEIGN